jgi:hypothetical protein
MKYSVMVEVERGETYKGNLVAWGVFIQGSSRVIYSPDKPLSCGAKVWIETDSEVIIDG